MATIILNEPELLAIAQAETDKKKCVIINDLMINFRDGRWIVTNAHTGQEMEVLNCIRK